MPNKLISLVFLLIFLIINNAYTENESVSIALQRAVETGVLNVIETGIERGYWEYEKTIIEPIDCGECIGIRG